MMTENQKLTLLPFALGLNQPDLVLKNASIIDVFTERILKGDVAIQEGYIVGIGDYAGKQEIDLEGRYICPDLIDAHVHIESSMAAPFIFASKILPHGTTTIIADPHEIVNVVGGRGIDYFLDTTKDIPVNVFLMLPSCVPLNSLEDNGATFGFDEMKQYKKSPRVLGLGELMDYPGVLALNPEIFKKIDLFNDRIVDGHAPSLSGKELQAYKLSGVQTEHECTTFEEALEKLQAGFYIQIREGSAAKNLDAIVRGIVKNNLSTDRFVFCTDDKHLEDINQNGHINYNIKKAIGLGLDPISAIKMATINTATIYGLKDLGAIAAGYRADLVVFNDLQNFNILQVYKDGKLYSDELIYHNAKIEDTSALLHTVHIPKIDRQSLQIRANENFPVIVVLPNEIITKKEYFAIPHENGIFQSKDDFLKIAVVNRHNHSNSVGVGILKGFGLKNGAIASTIAHDSHNLIVVSDNDDNMLCAIEELKRCQGGYTIVSGGKVVQTLELNVAGLFTDDVNISLEEKLKEMLKTARDMGVTEGIDPFITLSFLSLTVIPQLRITDKGLFDVGTESYIHIM